MSRHIIEELLEKFQGHVTMVGAASRHKYLNEQNDSSFWNTTHFDLRVDSDWLPIVAEYLRDYSDCKRNISMGSYGFPVGTYRYYECNRSKWWFKKGKQTVALIEQNLYDQLASSDIGCLGYRGHDEYVSTKPETYDVELLKERVKSKVFTCTANEYYEPHPHCTGLRKDGYRELD